LLHRRSNMIQTEQTFLRQFHFVKMICAV
jgi:hypothetical protein